MGTVVTDDPRVDVVEISPTAAYRPRALTERLSRRCLAQCRRAGLRRVGGFYSGASVLAALRAAGYGGRQVAKETPDEVEEVGEGVADGNVECVSIDVETDSLRDQLAQI